MRARRIGISLDGSATDPDTSTECAAGVEVKWDFASVGSIASEFGIASETFISDLTTLGKPDTYKWLYDQAQSVSMGSNGQIAQGFGVVTSAVHAHSGLNVEFPGQQFLLLR